MSDGELSWLAHHAKKCKYIIEIGSYLGRSTTALCDNCEGIVYSVDPYKGAYKSDDGRDVLYFDNDVYNQFLVNMKNYIESGKLIHQRKEFPEAVFPRKVDMIFIDGDHRELQVIVDIYTALEWSKPGTIISGHDYSHKDWPSVQKVVDKIFPEAQKVDSIWWILKS